MLQATDRQRCVIVVEDAETLQPKALSFLHFLPELSGQTTGELQIVLVGSPGLWRLMDDANLGRMREQIAVQIVVRPLSNEEARRFAAWRCQERLDRFGPPATDAAMVNALVRYGRGLPARIDALIDQVSLLARSHRGVEADLVAEAAAMLTDGGFEPISPPPSAPPAAPRPLPRLPPRRR